MLEWVLVGWLESCTYFSVIYIMLVAMYAVNQNHHMEFDHALPSDARNHGKHAYLLSTLGPSVILPPSHAQVVIKARKRHAFILAIHRHS